jgi:hypothetical protein
VVVVVVLVLAVFENRVSKNTVVVVVATEESVFGPVFPTTTLSFLLHSRPAWIVKMKMKKAEMILVVNQIHMPMNMVALRIGCSKTTTVTPEQHGAGKENTSLSVAFDTHSFLSLI